MKKLIATILIIITSPLVAIASGTEVTGNKLALYSKPMPIEDELLKSKYFPKVFPEFVKDSSPITDELMQTIKPVGKTIKLYARKSGEINKTVIEDELITPKFRAMVSPVSVLKTKQKVVIEDNFIKNNYKENSANRRLAKSKNKYDFTKTQIPVQLKIVKNLTTKHKILEGDSILFRTTKDVIIKGKKLPRGTNIIGRIETISASDKMGTPANMVIDNFYVQDNPEICLYGNITKTGANRSLWVYPLYQAGNITLYVAGFVFVPIHGGHAKLSTKETYTVFYETN